MKPSATKGNVIVYLVVLLLLFGVLGVIMTSLFMTSTASSVTPNQARRANYIAESAIRYAFSELRNSDFDPDVIETLNTTTYHLTPEGSFSFNIFSPWFNANETKNIQDIGGTLDLKVPEGKLTEDWVAKNPNGLWAVNYDSIDFDLEAARNLITSWEKIDDTTLRITVNGDLYVIEDERICLAVIPTETRTINEGGDLYVQEQAKDFFPEYDGAININRIDYVYKRLVHQPANNRVKLEHVTASAMPNVGTPFPLTVESTTPAEEIYGGDFIFLSPRNYLVMPTVTSGTVTIQGSLDNALNIYDLATVKPMTRRPDIDFKLEDPLTDALNIVETPEFITVSGKTIDIGSQSSNSAGPDFGAVWFNADKTIGGKSGKCVAGVCEFDRGVRVFFTLKYSGSADGLTFALINAANNTTSSSGGDIDMGELLGYGGDSRKKSDPTVATDFLDVDGASLSPPSPGLHPPKMALEFDTWINYGNQDYCGAHGSRLDDNRNDPGSNNRDAVQFVFWRYTSLPMPCRQYTIAGETVSNLPSYDDNRHDLSELDTPVWSYATSGPVRSTPAVDADGTIYVGSDDASNARLYAINPDGTLKWQSVVIDPVRSSPAIGDGVVYVGTDGYWIYSFEKESTNPTSHLIYKQFGAYAAVRTSPVVVAGVKDKIYVGTDDGSFYGLTPPDNDTSPYLVKEWEFDLEGPVSFGRPAIGPDGTIYVSHRSDADDKVYAFDPAEREAGATFPVAGKEWAFSTGSGGNGNLYMPGVDPVTGTIYSQISGRRIVAITPAGNKDWEFDIGTNSDSTPVVGTDGTVYFGADDRKLYAINPEDRKNAETFPTGREWTFTTGGQVDTTPAIAPDGTILVVSNDDHLYAVNPDGTLNWSFPIPVDASTQPVSSPTVGNEGVVYVGSSDNNLYAVKFNLALPLNYKDKLVTSVYDGVDTKVAGETVTVLSDDNWLSGDTSDMDTKKPWAVRLEVMRDPDPTCSNCEYTLRAWIRQCDSEETCGNIFGTFYEDTRVEYAATPHLSQTIELSAAQHFDFDKFIFGFTGASGSTKQSAVIANFKLSFIRENDPIAGD